MYSDPQNITYDLSKLFGFNFGHGLIVSGQFNLNVPVQPNSNNATFVSNPKSPESHMISYSTSKLYHQPYNFQVDNSQFSAVTSTTLRFYSSMDKSRGVGYTSAGGLGIGQYTNGGVINDNGDSTQTLRFYGSTYQGNVEGGSLMAQSSSTFPNNNIKFVE